jgi:hypothetical protein
LREGDRQTLSLAVDGGRAEITPGRPSERGSRARWVAGALGVVLAGVAVAFWRASRDGGGSVRGSVDTWVIRP